ncbi:MAG TPA: response regulator, partial [Gemmataceae bacterium]|nr:response regulator [Gemmataceae bacterium]
MRPRKVILLVDDDERVLSTRGYLLHIKGYAVIQATSGYQALTVLDSRRPGSLDLLLTDLLMADMDGNELCRRAKQMHPTLPTMIVSGVVSDSAHLVADGFSLKG